MDKYYIVIVLDNIKCIKYMFLSGKGKKHMYTCIRKILLIYQFCIRYIKISIYIDGAPQNGALLLYK